MVRLQQDGRLQGSILNIIKTYNSATESELQEGKSWYRVANSTAIELHPQGAAIIAALSPRKDWDSNVQAAIELVNTGRTTATLPINKHKAIRIINGEDPLKVLRGNKVLAFHRALAGDITSVVIDRHAHRVYKGDKVTKVERRGLDRIGAYDFIADAYKRASNILGVPAQIVQSVTWVVVRNKNREQ